MNFYTVSDLRMSTKNVWDNLTSDGEVVITNNGKPTAIMFNIADGSYEETLRAVRQAKVMLAFNSMRKKAAENGYMDLEESQLLLINIRSLENPAR